MLRQLNTKACTYNYYTILPLIALLAEMKVSLVRTDEGGRAAQKKGSDGHRWWKAFFVCAC